ncbi:MAG TPA: DUF342 domain-containing protein [Thermoanaerobacterales bacterium]|nr:DUF342 domain-containing protein [Thermoanaerobacterales bacterium]
MTYENISLAVDSFQDTEWMFFLYKDKTGTYACVKQGRLEVCHSEEGPYPMVIPCTEVKLVVNGRQYTKPVPVSMEDDVSLHTSDEIQKGHWSLTVSEDGLEAILKIKPTLIIHRKIRDLPPNRILKLEVEEEKEYKAPFTLDELIQELSLKGITYGIDWGKCSEAITSCKKGKIVIARGEPAKPGKEGHVELLFASKPKIPIKAEEDETVDFRQRYVYNSVEAGEILAIKHPPEIGTSGISVTGEIIIPPTPRDVVLAAGDGAILTKDGKRVVATRPGRPTVARRHNMVKVSVVNELVHNGDVDLSSGNIVYKGDILISGNVTENMSVESNQNIMIKGLVCAAKVQALGSVFVQGNILSSTITAGKTTDFQKKLLPALHILAEGLQEMAVSIQHLQEERNLTMRDDKEDIGPLLKFLLEKKYSYLIDAVKVLRQEAMLHEMCAEEIEFINNIKRALVECPLTVNNLSELLQLVQEASALEQALTYQPNTEGNIVALSIQNSKVIATGDIEVVGSGCYISQIQAGKNVNISGVVRGGTIRACGDVYIGELGSKGGAVATVVANPTSVVTIGRAFVNSVVRLGGRSYRFDREEQNIRFRMDKEGKLIFVNL